MASSEVLHTGGRRLINQILNGSVARPATLYLLLRQLDGVGAHTADAAASDTLSLNLNEVTTVTTGYARAVITFNAANFPETASGADSLITAALQTFNFTGAGLPINGITHAALATSADNSGVLICSAPLSTTRNVATGDSLNETFKFTMTAA